MIVAADRRRVGSQFTGVATAFRHHFLQSTELDGMNFLSSIGDRSASEYLESVLPFLQNVDGLEPNKEKGTRKRQRQQELAEILSSPSLAAQSDPLDQELESS